MTAVTFILVAMALTFLGGLYGGFNGAREQEDQEASQLFHSIAALAAGLALGVGLMVLIPRGHLMLGALTDFPVAHFLAAIGFLMLLFVERVVFQSEGNVTFSDRGGPSFYPFVLMWALSIHAVIAGMALSAMGDGTKVILLMAAILAQQLAGAYVLGRQVRLATLDDKVANKVLIGFAAMAPLGMAFGTIMTESFQGSGRDGFEGSFVAMAAGSFLYIAAVDLLREEFVEGQQRARLTKFILLLAGVLCVALVV